MVFLSQCHPDLQDPRVRVLPFTPKMLRHCWAAIMIQKRHFFPPPLPDTHTHTCFSVVL